MESLLTCPFCGNKPTVKEVFGRGWIVECPNILCVQQRYGHPTKEDAIADWNKRVEVK
jgi:hypothetical protein